MTLLLFLCVLAPLVDAFIQFWGPMNGMFSSMQPMANHVPMPMHMPMNMPNQMSMPNQMQIPNMMYLPRPSMYQPSFFPSRPILQPQPLMPPVSPNLSPALNIQTTTPNSFLSIFDALATILQREAQKSQYVRMQELANKAPYSWERPNYPENVQISDPNDEETPDFPQGDTEGLSSLINSLPAPEIVSLMNYQLANKRMKKLKTGPPIVKSFKIEKGIDEELPRSTPIEKDHSEKIDDDSLLGLLRSGRWKTIDWRRKLLGLDEIPTAEEGNALAQLFPNKDKE